jgi:hypothetical protein
MASRKKKFSKMILTLESVSQEDQFDEKKWRPKSRDTIPLNGRWYETRNVASCGPRLLSHCGAWNFTTGKLKI